MTCQQSAKVVCSKWSLINNDGRDRVGQTAVLNHVRDKAKAALLRSVPDLPERVRE